MVAAVTGTLGAVFAPRLLGVMGASPEVIAVGSGYTRVMLGGNAVILLLFLINATFRGAGDAAIAMRVLWLANWINILLGPCLIFGLGPFPQLGVQGAAIATTIGRGTGVLYQIYRLMRRDGRIVIHRDQLQLRSAVMRTLLRLSGTGTFRCSSARRAGLAGPDHLNVRRGGRRGLHDWRTDHRLRAATVMGARQRGGDDGGPGPRRREARARRTGGLDRRPLQHVFPGQRWTGVRILAGPIVSIFTHDPVVAPVAASCLRIVSCGYLFYAWGMVLTQSFNGAGDTWTPTWLNLCCFWLWEVPLAWALAVRFGFGPSGVFLAITTAFSTLAVVSAILFRRGRWKLRRV